MKIAVIGSGGWGTALAIVLHNNGHQVTLWSHTQQESERLDHARENPFLKGVVLPDVIACTSDPACVRGMGMVVMATPSFAVRQTAMRIAPYLEPETVVVSVTKGIEADTGKRMSEIVSEITGKTVAVLSGPSHAEEVARGVPTGCVAACADKRLADLVQDTFMSRRFRVYGSPDVIGVELAAALRDVIALCAGICDGLEYGDNTKALYVETLGNPNSDVVDIERLAQIAHAHKVPLVVDNTFATPYLVRPFEYGADIVVHSATKFIGGHGTSLGGVIVENGKFDWEGSGKFPHLCTPNPSYHGVTFTKAAPGAAFVTAIRAMLLRDMGGCISPFHAFIFLQGLETLSLRVERHVENALKVVQYLNNHPQVERVHHPSVSTDPEQQELYKKYFPNGGGSIFTFEIKGGKETAKKFCDNLELFSLLANVADVKSLVIHPASTTHAQLSEEELNEQGIYSNTIRLSIGTENIDDIIEDLEGGFQSV